MEIGIIGGGVAGLTAAWLLDHHHRVVLFEKSERLGGHARTEPVRRAGVDVPVDVAAQYFTPGMYPLFVRLLRLLGVRSRPTPTSTTIFAPGRAEPLLPALPPDIEHWRQWPRLARPAALLRLAQLGRAIHASGRLMQGDDWSLTVEQFAREVRLDPAFTREVLHPFLTIFCGPLVEGIEGVSARAALLYPHMQRPTLPREQRQPFEVCGGMQSYFEPLASRLRQAVIWRGKPVRGIERDGAKLVVVDHEGARASFDQLVLAVPAWDAAPLLDGLADAGQLRETLARFRSMPTASHIHSDREQMPRRRADWCFINQRVERPACKLIMWIGKRRGDDLFKTLTDEAAPEPRHLHGRHAFRHPIMGPDYFRAQADLALLQGQGGLWTVGSYTTGFEMHESGLLSAVRVAERICPESENLATLRRTPAELLVEERASR